MADFTYIPDSKYRVKADYSVLETEYDNQVEQRRLKGSHKIREWDLIFTVRDSTEFAAVIAFYDSKHGSLTSFTMDIDGETITGRFVKGSFSYEKIAYQIYNYGFKFKEVV